MGLSIVDGRFKSAKLVSYGCSIYYAAVQRSSSSVFYLTLQSFGQRPAISRLATSEIQPQRGKQRADFMVRAVLFIPQERCQNVYEALQERRSGSVAAIHHRKVDSVRSERFRVAERWLHWFQSEGSVYCALKVFAVDHVGLRKFPFRGDHGYALITFFTMCTPPSSRASVQSVERRVQLKIVSNRSGDDDLSVPSKHCRTGCQERWTGVS